MTVANTQRQQPKKFDFYLVNDDSLERLKILASECCHSIEDEEEVEDIMEEIRSRPHPAPQAPEQMQIDCPRCEGTGNLCDHPKASECEGESCPIDDRDKCDPKCNYMVPCDVCQPLAPVTAPKCNQFVPITQDEYDYLMKGWGNEHTEQIDEDVRQRQAAEINCCNCGVPKTSDGEPDCNDCAFSEEHDAAIARKAREQVLGEFQKFADQETQTKGFHSGWILGMALDQKIQSLRHHSEQQEQPR